MNTVELKIYVPPDWQELVIAELADLDFEAFEQEEDAVNAYAPAASWDDEKREQIEQWLRSHGLHVPLQECVIPAENWNRRWEETIRPLTVGPFLVKPTWADVPTAHAGHIVLEIDPKMSFGTGYHPSTRLVLRLVPDLVRPGHHVLDVGTGTGILAIAAVKLGAEWAVAVDIDPWAQQNAVENFYLNGVDDRIAFRPGSVEAVAESDFDLTLANINRNALLRLLPALAEKTRARGHLVLAGLLRTDRETMLHAAASHGFALHREADEDAWWAVVLRKDGLGGG